MSDYRAIAAVSSSIRDLLEAEMTTGAAVTVAPPDVEIADVADDRRVNLFLYKVEENTALKNMDLPGRGSPGAYGRPPLSLDLHYLLTAYGETEEDQIGTHEVLGDAMRVLHDHAVILGAALDPALQNEIEHVKLYLEPFSLEELSKIWSSLTVPMRISASYLVTVVQIENLLPRRYPRPVAATPAGGARIRAVPMLRSHIEHVHVIRHGDPNNVEHDVAYARIGDRLVLRGSGFVSTELHVMLGDVDATANIVSVAPDRIVVTIPDDAALQPGPMRVFTQNDVLLGEPETPHRGFTSNISAFVLVPEITLLTPDFVAQTLLIDGTRLWHADLPSVTIVGNESVAEYAIETSAQIAFDLPNLAAGDYLVRVRVNGAESLEEQVLVVP